MLRAVMTVIAAGRAISIDEELVKRSDTTRGRSRPIDRRNSDAARLADRIRVSSTTSGRYRTRRRRRLRAGPASSASDAGPALRTVPANRHLRNSAGRNKPLQYRSAGRPELRTPR